MSVLIFSSGAEPKLEGATALESVDELEGAAVPDTLEEPEICEESLLQRVIRTSLPIQGLMLLLLGIASLVPICEDEWECILANNLENSFEPMLRFVNGAPPI